MTSVSEKTNLRLRPNPPTARVRVWPLRDEPVRSAAVIGVVVAVSLAAAAAVNKVAIGCLLFGLLCLTVRRLWYPVTYEFGPKGLVYSTLGWRRRVIWANMVRYEIFPDGVLLSPLSASQPLCTLRGVFIRFNDQREELLAALDFYLHSPPANAPSTTRTMTAQPPHDHSMP